MTGLYRELELSPTVEVALAGQYRHTSESILARGRGRIVARWSRAL